jgi:hypothetical protein
MADVQNRYSLGEVLESLTEVVSCDSTNWTEVRRCVVCGQLWGIELPFSESHGGGPRCYYHLPVSDPEVWVASGPYVATRIRERDEDRAFLEVLGSEVGPDECREFGCTRKKIHLSVLCREHHFAMIKGRAPYA